MWNACGPDVHPCADKATRGARLSQERDLPVLLVNLGSSGKMKPRQAVSEIRRIQRPFHVVFISCRDEELREELLRHTTNMP